MMAKATFPMNPRDLVRLKKEMGICTNDFQSLLGIPITSWSALRRESKLPIRSQQPVSPKLAMTGHAVRHFNPTSSLLPRDDFLKSTMKRWKPIINQAGHNLGKLSLALGQSKSQAYGWASGKHGASHTVMKTLSLLDHEDPTIVIRNLEWLFQTADQEAQARGINDLFKRDGWVA